MEIPLSPLTPPATGHRILLSTTSSDSHTWNLMFLQPLLEERGHEVVNLARASRTTCWSRPPAAVVPAPS